MTLSENTAFLKDIHKVLQKHGLTLMHSSSPKHLVNETKEYEGHHFFFTKGNKKTERGVNEDGYPSSLTVRYSQSTNIEDDGN